MQNDLYRLFLYFAGEIRKTFLNEMISLIRKPLSDITGSPSSSKFSSPHCFAISLAPIDPAVHRKRIIYNYPPKGR